MNAPAWSWFWMILWASVILAITGCAHTPEPQPHSLFEQIPNWDGAALRTCCGGELTCEPWQSPRC